MSDIYATCGRTECVAEQERLDAKVAALEARCLAAEDDRDEWRALYEHGLQDRNELLARLAALKQEKDHAIALVGHRTACLEATEARCRELEAALKEAIGWNWGPSEIDDIPVEVLKQVNKALAPIASETP